MNLGMSEKQLPDFVIPAKAGSQLGQWIPAFAGMTNCSSGPFMQKENSPKREGAFRGVLARDRVVDVATAYGRSPRWLHIRQDVEVLNEVR